MSRLISAKSAPRLVFRLSFRPGSIRPNPRIRAASSNGLHSRVKDLLAADQSNHTRGKNLRDQSLADFLRLEVEINAVQQPNAAFIVEHSFARSGWLYINWKWQFADVTHGLTQLRMILEYRPYISALQPVAKKLIDLDFDWREDMTTLRKIWHVTIGGSHSSFLQRRLKVVLMSSLMFEKSSNGYIHMVHELQDLQRFTPLPERKGAPSSQLFNNMVKWYMKYLMTLHRVLVDCDMAYRQILVDRLRRQDPRYWIHDAIMYPFNMNRVRTDRIINKVRYIREGFVRKTSPDQWMSTHRRRQFEQLEAMVEISWRLTTLNRQIATLVLSFEPFAAHKVQQLSGKELEERANKAKETVRLFEDMERNFDPQTILRPPRTFRQYFEFVTRRQRSNEQEMVASPRRKTKRRLPS